MKKKDNVKELLVKDRFSKFEKISPKTIGVEIELPIINKNHNCIEMSNIQELFKFLIDELDFNVEKKDNQGNVILLINENNGDKISLEYSENTIEISLKEDYNLYNLKSRFEKYVHFIQKELNKFNYELQGEGINPNFKNINRNCLDDDRYLIIQKILTRTNKNKSIYNEFCAYICSIQTHLTPSIEDLVNVINVFSCIEWVKSILFSNSYIEELHSNLARDYLCEASNFGKQNTGTNMIYMNLDDLISDYCKRKLHYIEREKRFYMIESQSLETFFNKTKILGTDINDNARLFVPDAEDIKSFRSYKNVEVTTRGTIEIRSDCTQNIDDIFDVIAFNVGIFEKHKEINDLVKKYGFEDNIIERRKRKNVNPKINENEKAFIIKLIEIVYEGLRSRGKKEEDLIKNINEMRLNDEKSRSLVL